MAIRFHLPPLCDRCAGPVAHSADGWHCRHCDDVVSALWPGPPAAPRAPSEADLARAWGRVEGAAWGLVVGTLAGLALAAALSQTILP